MARSEQGRCRFTGSGRHFWLEVEKQEDGRTRYRCRNCGQETADLTRPIDAHEEEHR